MTNAMKKPFHTLTFVDGSQRMRYYLQKKMQHSGNRKKMSDREFLYMKGTQQTAKNLSNDKCYE